MKLRTKIVAYILVSITAVGIVASVSLIRLARQQMLVEAQSKGTAWTTALAANGKSALSVKNTQLLNSVLAETATESDLAFALFTDPQGRVLAARKRGEEDTAGATVGLEGTTTPTSVSIGRMFIARQPVYGVALSFPGFEFTDDGATGETDGLFEIASPEVPAQDDATTLLGFSVVGVSLAAADAKVAQMVRGATLTVLAGLLVFGLLGVALVRRVLSPLDALERAAERIGTGDFTARADTRMTNDELGRVAVMFNSMAGNLEAMVSSFDALSRRVDEEAAHIRASADSLVHGSKLQVQASEETGTSMEQINGQISMVATSTGHLARSVASTSSSAEELGAQIREISTQAERMSQRVVRAGGIVGRMVVSVDQVAGYVKSAESMSEKATAEAATSGNSVLTTVEHIRNVGKTMQSTTSMIGELGQLGGEIRKIVTVIEDIADQTNLLALNAAIEAARAGDAGRGFAVVADEVRKLAERSVSATKEIGSVIRQVVDKTEQAVAASTAGLRDTERGIELADDVVAAIDRIRGSVYETSNIVQKIGELSRSQSEATQEVTGAMNEMSQLTQDMGGATAEQAKGTEEIVRAVDDMQRQTDDVRIATVEQKRGGELVVGAVANILDVANGNLRAAEEMSAVAERLRQESDRLRTTLAGFHFSRD